MLFGDLEIRRDFFFNRWGSESGIYIIVYKKDPKVYYIGQASNFKKRFIAHSLTKLKVNFISY